MRTKKPQPPKYVPLSVYCAEYALDRRTVLKMADCGLVIVERIRLAGAVKPIIRVLNRAPWQRGTSFTGA